MPQPKRQSRPRIDAIVRHIKAGSYDDDIGLLQGAIADRQRIRQEHVAKLVAETFGEDYVVAPKSEKRNPFLDKNFVNKLAPDLEAAEQAARAREAELAKELGDPLPEDPQTSDIESRSPIIGGVERDSAGDGE